MNKTVKKVGTKSYAFDTQAFGTGMWKEITSSGKLGKVAKKEVQEKLGNITQPNQEQDKTQQIPTPGKSRIPNVDAIGQKIASKAPRGYAYSVFKKDSFGFKTEKAIRNTISNALGLNLETNRPLLGSDEYGKKVKKKKISLDPIQSDTVSPFSPSYTKDSSSTATPETKSSSGRRSSSNKILSSIDKKIDLSNGYLKKMSDELLQVKTKLFSENTIAVKFSKSSDSGKNLVDISTNIKQINESIKKIAEVQELNSLQGGGAGIGPGIDITDFGQKKGDGTGSKTKSPKFSSKGKGLAGLVAGMAAIGGGAYLLNKSKEDQSNVNTKQILEDSNKIPPQEQPTPKNIVPKEEIKIQPNPLDGLPEIKRDSIDLSPEEDKSTFLRAFPAINKDLTGPPKITSPAQEVKTSAKIATAPVVDLELNPKTGVYEAPAPKSQPWWEKTLEKVKTGSKFLKATGVASVIGAGLDVAINELTTVPELQALKQEVVQKLQNKEISQEEAEKAIEKIDDKIGESRGGATGRGIITGAGGAIGGTLGGLAGAAAGAGPGSVPLGAAGAVAGGTGGASVADWLLGDYAQSAGAFIGKKLLGGSKQSAKEQIEIMQRAMNPPIESGTMQTEIERINKESIEKNLPDITNTGDDMSLDYTKYPETGRPPQVEKIPQRPISNYNQIYDDSYNPLVSKNTSSTIPIPEQRRTGDVINQMGNQLAMSKHEAQSGGPTIINNNNISGGSGGIQQTHQIPLNIRNEENSLMRMQNGAAAYALT